MPRPDWFSTRSWLTWLLALLTLGAAGPDYGANFAAYLQRWHAQPLSQAETWWVVVPEKGCLSCQQRALQLAVPLLTRPHVRLLTSRALATRWLPAEALRQHTDQLVLDPGFAATAPLSRLDLPFPDYTGVVGVRGQKIIAFKPFNVQTCAQVLTQIPAHPRP